jgi:CheY-like chemotaxis protein
VAQRRARYTGWEFVGSSIVPSQRLRSQLQFQPIRSLAVFNLVRTRISIPAASNTALTCILLVEDNPADVLLVREALDEHGVDCDLVTAIDGEEAIRYLDGVEVGTNGPPALIILDLNLPRRSGGEVLRHIRMGNQCSQIPVVILSSSEDARDKQLAVDLGVTGYIRKPSDLKEFMTIGGLLKEILSKAREGHLSD